MANTLAEYEKKSVDPIVKGIAKVFIVESPWLRVLPWKGIASNTVKYAMETVEAAADFYDVGEAWIEGTPTWEDRYADLSILGGDADADKFAVSTGMVTEAEIVELKAKAIANRFAKCAILGRTTSVALYNSSKIFKGLYRLIAECESATTVDLDGAVYGVGTGNNSQVIVGASGASAVITLDMLDQLCDRVLPRPTHIVTSKHMRNKINSLARASGNNLVHDKDALGFPVTRWGDYPLLVDDGCPDNVLDPGGVVLAIASYVPATARAATVDNTPVFAVRVGEDGLCGITSAQNGMIQTEPIGTVQGKDADRTRIKFYCGMALFNKKAAAAYVGLSTE